MKRWLLFLLFCAAARADQPPPWLKLPSQGDARPAGASAWILDNSERVTQPHEGLVIFRYRLAVMILSEAGAKNAVCTLPFVAGANSVASARAWAMSPDGSKCREFGGNEFGIASTSVSNWVWDLSKVVFFYAERYVQPGWIVAWEVEIKSESTAFDIGWGPQNALPVRSASLELVPMAGGAVRWTAFSGSAPQPEAFGSEGGRRWTVANLPAFDREVPEDVERNQTYVRAYLMASPEETKTWGDVVRLARNEMEPKAVATPAIEAMAKRLAGAGGLWSRVLPVCRFVQKDVSYLELTIDSDSMAGYRPHPASEVCENRYGDCKDKALLLCTMLRVLGVEAHIMLVNYSAPGANRAEWPSANFNHAIVAIACREAPPDGTTVVRAGGADYLLFDPTDDQVPFGLLPANDAGGGGLVPAPGVSALATVPENSAAVVASTGDVRAVLADDGSAAVEFTEKRYGLSAAEAIERDDTEALADRTGALEGRIQRKVPLISDLKWESTGDAPSRSWSQKGSFTAQYYGRRMPGGMYVATDLMSAIPASNPWSDRSEGWVNVMPGTLRRTIEIVAPAGWDFSELPADWSTTSDAGQAFVRYTRQAGKARGEVELRIQGGVLDRKAYLEFRSLLLAATMAEHRPVVLRRIKAPAAPAAPAPHGS